MEVWLPLILTGTGSEVYTRRLAAKLTERGHSVTLDEIPHKFQYAPWLSSARRPQGTQVVIANSWNAASFGQLCPLVSVCHLVVHDPALDPFKSLAQKAFHRRFVLPMERAAVRRAGVNVAVSQKVARQMERHIGSERVRVVPNGVDTEFFTPAPKTPSDKLRLLFVGKPSKRKGFDVVRQIVAALGDRAEFTCVGERPTGAPPPGNYLGRVDRNELRAIYRSADILLFPSRMEGFGLVAAEAMACGTPVAAFRGTAVDEIVPENAGIVCETADELLSRLLALPREGWSRAGEAARLHAAAKLNEGPWIDGIEGTMREAVEFSLLPYD